MDSTIIAKGIDANQSLREYIKQSIDAALGYAKESIDYITVRLTDTNGAKGGVDKRCLINVKLPGRPQIVITEIAADLTSAIDRAAQRASVAVGRVVSRGKSIPHATLPMYMKNLNHLAI